jgi:benzoate/toluate 1,2-dioxygenase subunit alpha
VSARDLERGNFTFKGGHNLLWSANDEPEVRAVWLSKDTVRPRVGDLKFQWMLNTRNLFLFPNVQILDASSLQVRVIRPLAADKTEVSTYCIAPKGESKEARVKRIRQYEEFYNPTGFATPDDLAVFDACQRGQASEWITWHQGYMRGLADFKAGADAHAEALGIKPLTSVTTTEARGDETLYHPHYREWAKLLMEGLSREKSLA